MLERALFSPQDRLQLVGNRPGLTMDHRVGAREDVDVNAGWAKFPIAGVPAWSTAVPTARQFAGVGPQHIAPIADHAGDHRTSKQETPPRGRGFGTVVVERNRSDVEIYVDGSGDCSERLSHFVE